MNFFWAAERQKNEKNCQQNSHTREPTKRNPTKMRKPNKKNEPEFGTSMGQTKPEIAYLITDEKCLFDIVSKDNLKKSSN